MESISIMDKEVMSLNQTNKVTDNSSEQMQMDAGKVKQEAGNTEEKIQTQNKNNALGALPAKAPLANAYVPYQQPDSDQYEPKFGFIRGTLFPGLDLPFMGLVNTTEKNQPINELQALNFAISELGLYLDTHYNDVEALDLFNTYQKLYQEGVNTYQKLYGPLSLQAVGTDGAYDWLKDPWPWDYNQTVEVSE